MNRNELEKKVLGCIAVYLQRESQAFELESGGLDADPTSGSYTLEATTDTRLCDLGISEWDLRQVIKMLSKELGRGIYLDAEAVFDDERDMTIGQLVDAIYTASSS